MSKLDNLQPGDYIAIFGYGEIFKAAVDRKTKTQLIAIVNFSGLNSRDIVKRFSIRTSQEIGGQAWAEPFTDEHTARMAEIESAKKRENISQKLPRVLAQESSPMNKPNYAGKERRVECLVGQLRAMIDDPRVKIGWIEQATLREAADELERLRKAPNRRQGTRRPISIGIYEAGIGCRKNKKGDI